MKKCHFLPIVLFFGLLAGPLSSCNSSRPASHEPSEIEKIYALYVDNGGTLSYEEWLAGIKGEPGKDGKDGKDGQTPYIGENGNWWIGETDTGIKAEGVDGKDGTDGKDGEDGHAPTITIGANGNWFVDGEDTGAKAQGDSGVSGQDGVSISKIEKTGSNGNVDTYTITFSDGTTFVYTVKNGQDGEKGDKGDKGDQGDSGDDGLSAYEIYIKYHPEYTGTEEEWLEDLVNGNLREKYTVTFNSNGGTPIDTQYVSYGHLVTRPYDDPVKTGYLFDGWYLNSDPFPFTTYQVYENLNLYARWKSQKLTVTLDADGGQVEYNTKTITYGVDYVLPTPTYEHHVFEGWYYDETDLIPMSGIWDFSKDSITLKARWSSTFASLTLITDEVVSVTDTEHQIEYGKYFSLPVPTISTGDQFIGWALEDGTLITDSEGDSIKKSAFTTGATLHAVYYILVYSAQQFLSITNEDEVGLKRTYVLQNDLDFTGLSNEAINNFCGILNGNGYRIIGMNSTMFGSVGSLGGSSAEIVIKDLSFVNFGGGAIVEQINNCASLSITNVTISSFQKDANDYCPFRGFVGTSGNKPNLRRPQNLIIENCHILDEWATVISGFINNLQHFKNVSIKKCSMHASATKAAFIAWDGYGDMPPWTSYDVNTTGKPDYDVFDITNWPFSKRDLSGSLDKSFSERFNTSITIDLCSNFGATPYFVRASAGGYNTGQEARRCPSYYYGDPKEGGLFSGIAHRVSATNCVNYGELSDSVFDNIYRDGKTIQTLSQFNGNNQIYYFVFRSPLEGSYKISRFLNFGAIGALEARTGHSKWVEDHGKDSWPQNFSVSLFLNAGRTESPSFQETDSLVNAYCYTPITGVLEPGANEITALSQINKDFFINVLNLDPDLWDLSYIKVDDEYGLPKIIY